MPKRTACLPARWSCSCCGCFGRRRCTATRSPSGFASCRAINSVSKRDRLSRPSEGTRQRLAQGRLDHLGYRPQRPNVSAHRKGTEAARDRARRLPARLGCDPRHSRILIAEGACLPHLLPASLAPAESPPLRARADAGDARASRDDGGSGRLRRPLPPPRGLARRLGLELARRCIQDLRQGLRALRHSPGFAVTGVPDPRLRDRPQPQLLSGRERRAAPAAHRSGRQRPWCGSTAMARHSVRTVSRTPLRIVRENYVLSAVLAPVGQRVAWGEDAARSMRHSCRPTGSSS